MKRIIALVLSLVLVLAFAVSAVALVSPGGLVYRKIIVNRTNTGTNSTQPEAFVVIVGENGTVTVVPKESETLTFEGWALFGFWNVTTKKGTPAKAGTDYEIIEVKLKDGTPAIEGVDYRLDKEGYISAIDGKLITVTIKPLIDMLYVSEAYEGVEIIFNLKEPYSPDNGDTVAALAAMVGVLALGGLVLTRKRDF